MKKKITALLAGIFALGITAFAQPTPSVTFTPTPAAVCAGGSVIFTNTATNFPTQWRWYFPGGSPDTIIVNGGTGNPPIPIQYNYPGTYSVTCVVINNNLPLNYDSVIVNACVTVLPLPKARVEPPYGGICTPQDTVYFHMIDTSRGNTYSWTPNGATSGLSCTNCESPHASPTVTTVYTIIVTGADGCTITLHDTVTVGPSPTACHITGRDSVCAGLADTLYASGGSQSPPGTTYAWSNGKTTSSIIVNPPAGNTTYSVSINYGSGGCTGTATFPVHAFGIPSFTITSPDSICFGGLPATIGLSPPMGSPYEYFWFGPNAAPDTSQTYTVSPAVTTTYTLVVRNVGCYFDSLVKIKVNYPPAVHFTGATDLCDGSSATICAFGGDQYTWSTGQTTSCINETAVTGIVGLTYTVQVRAGACFKDTTFTTTYDSMPRNIFIVKGNNSKGNLGDTSICSGDSVTIWASSTTGHITQGYQYTFLWNNGLTTDTLHTGELDSTVTYWVKVTHGACSLDSASITIKVYPPPIPGASKYKATICQWDSVSLNAWGGVYYEWTPSPAGLGHYLRYTNTDTDKNMASPAVTTVYTVNVCSWGCCRRDTITVNVTPGVLGFNVCCSQTISSGTPVSLSATFDPGPYEVYQWVPSTGLSCTNCANPTATVDSTTKYVVTFLDQLTGCTVNDSIVITVFNCTVFVPNAFSPNGDGVNDHLYVRSLCLKSMDFAVFDRFGNQVFHTINQNDPWDGTFHGKPMEVGTYMWYLSALLSDGTHISRSGNVTLVR